MSHLLIHPTPVSYPLIRGITLPSIDIENILADISAKINRVFAGSLMFDFWTLFTAGI